MFIHIVFLLQLEPYLMENPDYYYDNAQPRFVGFIPDLMKEIADLTGINYVIMTSPDNSFGYRQSNGAWDGMIGELLRRVRWVSYTVAIWLNVNC